MGPNGGAERDQDVLELGEPIGAGAHSQVFAARWQGRDVAVKRAVRSEVDAPGTLAAFRREAATAGRIPHPGVVQVFGVGSDGSHRPYLILERVPGETLASRLARGPMPEAEAVKLAVALTDALQAVHARGVVHRDIKPGNILLDDASQPKLIDFGLAVRNLQQDRDTAVGTFLYSAPEQTGMLARAVDPPADLYGLGAVLYECVAGQPPFWHEDAAELIRMHGTESPVPLRARGAGVSEAFSAIVDKLLAKDPDDRYGNASALQQDLLGMHALKPPWEQSLARGDRAPVPELGVPLVGRKEAYEALAQHVVDAVQGTGSVVRLSANAGVGKTRLARALAQQHGKQGMVLWGECVPDLSTAFGTLDGAFCRAVRDAERKGPQAVEGLRAQLEEAADRYAPYLAQVLPSLRPWLGGQDDAAAARAETELFFDAVAELLRRLGRNRPLLLVVDGAQWCDSASARVLQRLAALAAHSRLCVLVCEREAVLDLRADACQELGPLSDAAMVELAEAFLGGTRMAGELGRDLIHRAAGNPGVLLELLQVACEEGGIVPGPHGWESSIDDWGAVGLSGDLRDLCLARFERLPEASREPLRLAATIGSQFDASVLGAVAGLSLEQVEGALTGALEARLIERTSPGHFRFAHLRLQEQLAQQLDAANAGALHRRIAQALEEAGGSDERALYAIARHRFLGRTTDRAERVYESNRRAGKVAFEHHALDEARTFLERARDWAREQELPLHYDVSECLAECHSQSGRVDDGLPLYREALESCDDPEARTRIHLRLAELLGLSRYDSIGMDRHLRLAWKEWGEQMPRPGLGCMLAGVAYLWTAVALHFFGRLRRKEKPVQRREAVFVELCERTAMHGLFVNQISVLVYCSARATFTCTRMGPSLERVMGHASLGHLLINFGFPMRTMEYFARRAQMDGERLGDPMAVTRARFLYGIGLSLAGCMRQGAEHLKGILARELALLPTADALTGLMDVALSQNQRGYMTETREMIERAMTRIEMRLSEGDSRADSLAPFLIACHAVAGRVGEIPSLLRKLDQGADSPDNTFRWVVRWSVEVWFRYETDDMGEAVDHAIDQTERAGYKPAFTSWHFSYFWVHKAYIRHRQYEMAPDQRKAAAWKRFERAVAELAQVCRHPLHRPHLSVLRAMQSLRRGKPRRALDRIDRAQRQAHAVDNPWALFEARAVQAAAYRKLGNESAAERCVEEALGLAERRGWVSRAARLRRRFGRMPVTQQDGTVSSNRAATVGITQVAAHSVGLQRDRDALLQVSLAASESLDPVQQAQSALDKLIQILGGERAMFFATERDGQLVRVAARGMHGTDLPAQESYARSVVERVAQSREPIIMSGTEEGQRLGSQSAVAQNLRSMVCAPLVLGEQVKGVVYLDSRLAKGVFTPADLDILIAIANHIAISRESALAARREIERHELEKDRQLTGMVQALLVPAQMRARHGAASLAASYRPAEVVGGDWWYHDVTDDGALRVWIGDVTGHGAGAAMVTAAVAGCYQASVSAGQADSEALIGRLHATLRRTCGGSYTMPLCVVEVDASGRSLRWWSAAAPPLLIRRADGRQEVITGKGIPLGSECLDVGHGELSLEAGDVVLAYSDGVTEMPLPGGRELGLRRLARLFKRDAGVSAEAVRDRVMRGIDGFREDVPPDDDLTFVVLAVD